MGEEKPIQFKSIDLMWLVSVDLVDYIEDMSLAIKRIFQECEYCTGFLKYYTSDERWKGGGEIKIKDSIKDPTKQKFNDFLELFKKVDLDTLDPEYLESQSFSRFLLKDLKLKLDPLSQKLYDCKVLLTISKFGIAIFTFWVRIEKYLDSAEISELQLLPIREDKLITVEFPKELLKELGDIDINFLEFYKNMKNSGEVSKILEINFKGLILAFWITLVNVLTNRKYSSTKIEDNKFLKKRKYRYETQYVFPIVTINSTEPKFQYPDDIIKNNPRQLYQILSHLHDFDYRIIRSEVLDEFLKPNLTQRRDIAYLDALGSVILIFSSELLEKEYYFLEAFIIIEIIQIQRFYIGLLSEKLDRPIAKMNPRHISIMRSYLSQELDMYYSKITRTSLARRRLEHGRGIMELDIKFNMLNQKIELMSEALNSFSTLKTSAFEVSITLIVGFLSVFYVFLQFEDPALNLILGITLVGITFGFVIGFTIISRYIWRWLRTKRIK